MLTSCVCSAQIAHTLTTHISDAGKSYSVNKSWVEHKFFMREHDTVLINFNRYFIGILCGVIAFLCALVFLCALLGSFLIDPNLHTFAVYMNEIRAQKMRISCKSFFLGVGMEPNNSSNVERIYLSTFAFERASHGHTAQQRHTRKTIDNQESGEQAAGFILMSYYALEQTAGRCRRRGGIAGTYSRKSISSCAWCWPLRNYQFSSV